MSSSTLQPTYAQSNSHHPSSLPSLQVAAEEESFTFPAQVDAVMPREVDCEGVNLHYTIYIYIYIHLCTVLKYFS